jgi:SAM-dependent methyltransferase
MLRSKFNASGYDDQYFNARSAAALESARVVVPILLRFTTPRSVLDVGCARGEWLSVFREHGVEQIKGFDGEYLDQSKLLIPEDRFRAVDLLQPFTVDQNWDLAICLEVAEHLFPNRAKGLIKDLTKAAPIILFSAAVPGQGGPLHLNEQWPGYWKNLFAEHDYVRLDLIRPLIWQDPRVNWWYQQNVYLFAGPEALRHSTALRATVETAADPQLELLNEAALYRLTSLSGIVRELLPATGKMVANRWRRLKNNRG